MGFTHGARGVVSDWAKIFAEQLGAELPEGYETTQAIASKLGDSLAKTYNRLQRLHAKGLVERVKVSYEGAQQVAWRFKG
jgi:predicted transcriptional regulator